jgi:hypothetical protein
MKKYNIFLGLIAILGLWSCNKYDYDFQDTALVTAPTLTSPANGSSLVIQTADLSNDMDISWSAADYGYSGNINYYVELAKAGTNFAAPYSFSKTGFNKTSITGFTVKDLNNAILALGCTRGEAADLEMRVCSTTNGVSGRACSTVNALTVTTYAVYPVMVLPETDAIFTVDSTTMQTQWTATDYGNGENFTYTIQIAVVGTDFDPVIWTGTTTDLNYPIGLQELNEQLLNAGYEDGNNVSLEIRVVASAPNVESATTNVVPFVMIVNAPKISIIGEATPSGNWVDDTFMSDDDHDGIYTLVAALSAGPMKFRKNGSWSENWGGAVYPSGTAVFNASDNVQITTAGVYLITFNLNTFEVSFQSPPISMIGEAIVDWNTDFQMQRMDGGVYSLIIGLKPGKQFKFRANNAWVHSWGNPAFPSGTADYNGANIEVPAGQGGVYKVVFNLLTGAYTCTPVSIGIIGSATPGGWNVDTNMTPDANDPNVLTANITLSDGEVKFRADDAWVDDWGGTAFPSGTATYKGGNITAAAGTYNVTFNIATLAYSFN